MKTVRRAFAELVESFRIAFGALTGARMRTFLTTLGIVIGVSTVIAIVAIIQGLDRSFEEQIQFLGAHTLYVDRAPWIQSDDTWWMYRNRKKITVDEFRAVQRESQLAVAVAPMGGRAMRFSISSRGAKSGSNCSLGSRDSQSNWARSWRCCRRRWARSAIGPAPGNRNNSWNHR